MTNDSETNPPYAEGDILGPFVIRECLRLEASATVYKAGYGVPAIEVELKIFRAPETDNWNQDTAQIICRLRHPNIVSTYFAGIINGHLVIATEPEQGTALCDVLRENRRLESVEALRICSCVVSALECAHTFPTDGLPPLAHLNLQPSKIILGPAGTVKIAGVGVAQALGAGASPPGGIVGSPAHMAPEQFCGTPSAQSDFWAVGILLYEMLLGRTPFSGKSPDEFQIKITTQDLQIDPDLASLPAPLIVIIHGCLRRDPGERYSTAGELLKELTAAALAPLPLRCPRCGAQLSSEKDPCIGCLLSEVRESYSERRWGSKRSSQALRHSGRFHLRMALVLIGILAVGGGGLLIWQSLPPTQGAPQEGSDFSLSKTVPQQPRQLTAGRESGSLRGSPEPNGFEVRMRTSAAAQREWEDVLAYEKSYGGSYEDRIERFGKFLEAYPEIAESRPALEKRRIWEDESRAFRNACDAELKPGARVCANLSQWQEFLSRQTTGLRRAFAMERIQYWTRRLTDYLGNAELTIHSARALPPADRDFFRHGQPDAYFELLDGGNVVYRSRILKNNSSPVWDETARIYIWRGLVLTLEIWDDDLFRRHLILRQQLTPLPADGRYQASRGNIMIDLEIQREE